MNENDRRGVKERKIFFTISLLLYEKLNERFEDKGNQRKFGDEITQT